jgi:hypothetical protein
VVDAPAAAIGDGNIVAAVKVLPKQPRRIFMRSFQ